VADKDLNVAMRSEVGADPSLLSLANDSRSKETTLAGEREEARPLFGIELARASV
jgi:hypothetical protein